MPSAQRGRGVGCSKVAPEVVESVVYIQDSRPMVVFNNFVGAQENAESPPKKTRVETSQTATEDADQVIDLDLARAELKQLVDSNRERNDKNP